MSCIISRSIIMHFILVTIDAKSCVRNWERIMTLYLQYSTVVFLIVLISQPRCLMVFFGLLICHWSLLQVYACMGSWAQLASFPEESLVNSSLIRAPFQTLVKCQLSLMLLFIISAETARSTPKVV